MPHDHAAEDLANTPYEARVSNAPLVREALGIPRWRWMLLRVAFALGITPKTTED